MKISTRELRRWAKVVRNYFGTKGQDRVLAIAAELDWLNKLVKQHLTTADGVVFKKGMRAFDKDGVEWTLYEPRGGWEQDIPMRELYSTRAAAEAARAALGLDGIRATKPPEPPQNAACFAPCPFCGERNNIEFCAPKDASDHLVWVECRQCGALGPTWEHAIYAEALQQAKRAWNRHSPDHLCVSLPQQSPAAKG